MKTNMERLIEVLHANPIPGGNVAPLARTVQLQWEEAISLLNTTYHTLNRIGAEVDSLDTEMDFRIASKIDSLMKPLASFLHREYTLIIEEDDDE